MTTKKTTGNASASDDAATETSPAETETRASSEVEPTAAKAESESEDAAAEDGKVAGETDDSPPIPDEIREAGRIAPDHWLGMVDPTWSGEGEPPEWAMVGRWRSGLDGEIEEWQDNPEYRPSPNALGWPEPEDEVDKAIQLAATGYGPGEAVTEALVDREVAIFVKPGGGPLAATTPDGTSVVPVFTSPVYVHTAGRLAFELLKVNDLVDQIPEGHLLYLNPSGPVSMTLELDVLRDAIAGNGQARTTPTVSGEAAKAPMTTVSLDAVIDQEEPASDTAVQNGKTQEAAG